MAGIYAFGPFRLDGEEGILFHGARPLAVGSKAVALLRVLIEHPSAPVSKNKLIDAAWAGLAVEESNLSVQIAALRKALGAEPGGELWIETLPRRGYRFIGPAHARSNLATIQPMTPVSGAAPSGRRARWLVGRSAPLQTLDSVARRMLAGERQMVFVTGEAGIGKTAFLEMAMEHLSRYNVEVMCGRCTERFGAGEAFEPLVDALWTRCRGPGGSALFDSIRTHAPTWLIQMPGFLENAEGAAIKDEVFGATRERMRREFCDLVEKLSADRPLVLMIEDLHWSDFATLDVLSRFAREEGRASALVLATYRPAETIRDAHPVRRLHQDLEIHGRCAELRLDRLSREEIESFLALRFEDDKLASALADPLFGRTQGQPLFLTSLLDHLIDQRAIVETDGAWRLNSPTIAIASDEVPNELMNMIMHQIDGLDGDERRLLDVASVAGADCSAALVAAGLALDPLEVEQALDALARKDATMAPSEASEWPDGTYSGGYAFRHILYQNVLYQRLTPGRRVQIHRRMGERLEQAYGDRTEEIATVLALHFEQGRDFPRALHYLQQAAESSARRLAHDDSANYLTRALGILDRFAAEDRYGPRIALLRQRSWALRSSGDLAGSVRDLNEMIACAAAAGQLRQEVNGLLSVSRFCMLADRRMCLDASKEALTKSEGLEDEVLKALVQGSSASINLYLKGWREQDAALCLKALRATAGARNHSTRIRRDGIEGILECLRSHYRECYISATDGKALAQKVGDVYTFVLFNVLESAALIHLGEWRQLQRETKAALALAEKNANRPAIALCRLTLAWLHVEAMDFDGARDLCEDVHEEVLDENPCAFFFHRAVLAKAFVGMNEAWRAGELFDDVARRINTEGIGLDYTIYTQLYYCCGEYGLQVGDIVRARNSADKLYDYAASAPDHNHLALAYDLRARLALAEGDLAEARAQLSLALSTLGDKDLPLAQWRVHRTAAEIYARLGEDDEAATHRGRFEQVLRTLAENFDPGDRLRTSLLAAVDAGRDQRAGCEKLTNLD